MGGFEGSLALLHAAAVAGTKMVAVMAAIAAWVDEAGRTPAAVAADEERERRWAAEGARETGERGRRARGRVDGRDGRERERESAVCVYEAGLTVARR